uniref:Small integral membrane protein 15 n=1 Tax=Propithecus coquereli TaxID=379532 RepID=A0A2K6G3S3_PROCO
MSDIKAWDPYGFLILALTSWFLSAVLSWKLANMIEAREKEQKRKQKCQKILQKLNDYKR